MFGVLVRSPEPSQGWWWFRARRGAGFGLRQILFPVLGLKVKTGLLGLPPAILLEKFHWAIWDSIQATGTHVPLL